MLKMLTPHENSYDEALRVDANLRALEQDIGIGGDVDAAQESNEVKLRVEAIIRALEERLGKAVPHKKATM